MLKIVVITQEDLFSIPNNIELLCMSPKLQIESIFVINSKGSLVNKKYLFLKGFGLIQCIKLFILRVKYKIFNKTILKVAKDYSINYRTTSNPNTSDCIEHIKYLNIDLIVSFSAPVVFGSKLLSAFLNMVV